MYSVVEGHRLTPPGFDFDRSCIDTEFISHGHILTRQYERRWGKQKPNPQEDILLVLIDPQNFLATENPITQRLGGLSANYTMITQWTNIACKTAAQLGPENILVTYMTHNPDNLSEKRRIELKEGPCADLTHQDPQGKLRFPHLEPDSPLTRVSSQLASGATFRAMEKNGRSLLEDPQIKNTLRMYPQVAMCGVDATVCLAATLIDYFERDWGDWGFDLLLLPQLISDRWVNFERTQEMFRLIIEMGMPKIISITAYLSYISRRKS